MTLVLGVNPCVVGLNYHDPSVAFIDGDRLVFASEEQKHLGRKVHGIFPERAYADGLAALGRDPEEIERVGIGFDPALLAHRPCIGATNAERAEFLGRSELGFRLGVPPTKIEFLEHHLCHAASAYLCSHLDRCLVVVNDGAGEVAATSVWIGEGGRLAKLDEVGVEGSLGYFYAAVTAYLGFEPWAHEGKTMALAPYGQPPRELEEQLAGLFLRDGEVSLHRFRSCFRDGYWFDFPLAARIIADALALPVATDPYSSDARYRDIACWAQQILESSVSRRITAAITKTGITDVCVAGGVHLNCKLNGVLRELPEVTRFFVQPVAGDAGLAIGSALLCRDDPTVQEPLDNLFLGPGLRPDRVIQEVGSLGPLCSFAAFDAAAVADDLARGRVVFWVRGRAELGPRALGHRSILADPTDVALAHRIGAEIKDRELWRPYAPTLLRRAATEVLETSKPQMDGRFMVESWRLRPSWADRLAGVAHPADNSCRPQVVDARTDARISELIEAFAGRTGVPAVLNTSLNPRGRPILTDEREIARWFCASPADLLVCEDVVITKASA